MMQVSHVPPRRLGVVEHAGAYAQLGAAFQRVAELAPGRGPKLAVCVVTPDETESEDELRTWASVEIPEGPIPDGLEERTVPGGAYATARLEGPLDGLFQAWGALYEAVQAAPDVEIRDDAYGYEVYVRPYGEVEPADAVTELFMPVREV